MLKARRWIVVTMLITIAGASAIGCGGMPTRPTLDAPPQSSVQAAPSGLISDLLGDLVGLLVRVLHLNGDLGGTLANGRWNLVVPPGAVEGTATISLGVPSLTSDRCVLQILPLEKNQFDVAAHLTVDCRSVPDSDLASYVISVYDPASRQWVPVAGSKVNPRSKTVSAPLQRGASYTVGKPGGRAGW